MPVEVPVGEEGGERDAEERAEERSVVVCEWLLTMEGVLAQTRGLKKRHLSLVVGESEH